MGCTEQEKKGQEIEEPVIPEFAPIVQVSEDNTTVMVKGIFNLLYDTELDLSKFLSVYVIEKDSSWNKDSSPILGTYSYLSNEGALVFKPKYPFLENTEYYVRFDYNSIVETPIYIQQPNMQFVVEHSFEISQDKTPVIFVEEVYPTTNQVPRNLLKFYVQFSGSMTEGQMLEHVRILDDKREIVEHAFLEIPQELWDVNQQRLTILFDPGRIKRGMELLDEVGAPFKIDQQYILQIDKAWKDGQQRSLTQSFEKTFVIIEDDRAKPEKENWTISTPLARTNDPLKLHFTEPMDYALLNRVITVLDNKNQPLSGKIDLTQEESVWKFTPDNLWEKGAYSIQIKSILEDLAGNSLASVFDVDLINDLESASESSDKESFNLSFEIQ